MLVCAHPLAPGARIKEGARKGGQQDSVMPTATELELVVAAANANLEKLAQQQVEVKGQEEKETRDQEEREAKEAKVGT